MKTKIKRLITLNDANFKLLQIIKSKKKSFFKIKKVYKNAKNKS